MLVLSKLLLQLNLDTMNMNVKEIWNFTLQMSIYNICVLIMNIEHNLFFFSDVTLL